MADFNFYLNKQGIQGRKGDKGEDGFSPTITVDTETLNDYTLRITNENSTIVTPNLRGNRPIKDNGGTYVRVEADGSLSASTADLATSEKDGVVRLSTPEDITNMSEITVVTPSTLADALSKYIEAGTPNVTITQDEITDKTQISVDTFDINARLDMAEEDITRMQEHQYQVDGLVANNVGEIANLEKNKQDKLVAGKNITIEGNVISAEGGKLPTNLVTTDTDQELTGKKTFKDLSAQGGALVGMQEVDASLVQAAQLGTNNIIGHNDIFVEPNLLLNGSNGIYNDAAYSSKFLHQDSVTAGTNITIDKKDGGIVINATGGSADNVVTTDTPQEITASKTFTDNQAIKSNTLDVHTDRNKSGGELKFLDKNGVNVGTLHSYVNNNGTPELRMVASNGNQSAFAGLGMTTDGQPFFEVPEPAANANNSDAPTTKWVNDKLAHTLDIDVSNISEAGKEAIKTIAGGGSLPANVVTTDGYQELTNKFYVTEEGYISIGSSRSGANKYSTITGSAPVNHLNTNDTLKCWAFNYDPRYSKGTTSGEASSQVTTYEPYLRKGNITVGDGINIEETRDNTNTITGIKISATGGGGGATPENMVTTNTEQDITAFKTFDAYGGIKFKNSYYNIPMYKSPSNDCKVYLDKGTLQIRGMGEYSGGLQLSDENQQNPIFRMYLDGSYAQGYKTYLMHTTNYHCGLVMGENSLLYKYMNGTTKDLLANGGGGSITRATEAELGGIKAAPKTAADVLEAKIDEATGKLYVQPSSLKADTSLNNITKPAKQMISGLSMPSDKCDNLVLGASGTKYTAPANGFFYLEKKVGNSAYYNKLINLNTKMADVGSGGNGQLFTTCTIDCVKGDICQVEYNSQGEVAKFMFVYAGGEV